MAEEVIMKVLGYFQQIFKSLSRRIVREGGAANNIPGQFIVGGKWQNNFTTTVHLGQSGWSLDHLENEGKDRLVA